MTPPIAELAQRLRELAETTLAMSGSIGPEARIVGVSAVRVKEAADALTVQAARITTLEQTLREIALADTAEWDDPSEFEGWAKGRARGALGEPK